MFPGKKAEEKAILGINCNCPQCIALIISFNSHHTFNTFTRSEVFKATFPSKLAILSVGEKSIHINLICSLMAFFRELSKFPRIDFNFELIQNLHISGGVLTAVTINKR